MRKALGGVIGLTENPVPEITKLIGQFESEFNVLH